MRIALVQQPATDDLADNLARGLAAFDRAADAGADLVAYAELAFSPFYPQRHATPGSCQLAEPIPGPHRGGISGALRRARRGGGAEPL